MSSAVKTPQTKKIFTETVYTLAAAGAHRGGVGAVASPQQSGYYQMFMFWK
jgi:hypothetical protein